MSIPTYSHSTSIQYWPPTRAPVIHGFTYNIRLYSCPIGDPLRLIRPDMLKSVLINHKYPKITNIHIYSPVCSYPHKSAYTSHINYFSSRQSANMRTSLLSPVIVIRFSLGQFVKNSRMVRISAQTNKLILHLEIFANIPEFNHFHPLKYLLSCLNIRKCW